MRRSFAALVAELVGEIARDGGAGPAGFTGGEFPSAFGGFEGEELCAGCSLVEVYEAGVAPELARSFVRDGGRVVSTVFVPEKPGPRAAWSPWEVLARAGRGDDGAVIWSSGAIFAAGGDELNEAGRALAEAVAAAARLKSLLVERGAAPIAAPVALYENAATPRALWLLDSTVDGATWPNRLTSWESSHSSSVASREGWAAALRAASLPYRFVGARGLLDGRLADEGVRCIVLHEAAALSDREIDGLLAFAREGGLVIGDADAAWFDERLRGREPAALARLFGVERPAGRTLAQVASEAADASTALHASEREVGRGATLWLGRRVMLRPDDAPEKGKGRELRRDLVELGREVAERLRARGFAASPRLPDDVAGRARLHRHRLAGGGELAIVVATAPAGAPLSTSLAFDEDVAVEPIEPKGRAIARLARGTPLPVVVDDRHAFVVRWSPER
jgi:hypothetical protein